MPAKLPGVMLLILNTLLASLLLLLKQIAPRPLSSPAACTHPQHPSPAPQKQSSNLPRACGYSCPECLRVEHSPYPATESHTSRKCVCQWYPWKGHCWPPVTSKAPWKAAARPQQKTISQGDVLGSHRKVKLTEVF